MEDFHNPDGTMAAPMILPLCGKRGISNQSSNFILLRHRLARVRNLYVRTRLGWKNVSVYDGGWYEWSSDPKIR